MGKATMPFPPYMRGSQIIVLAALAAPALVGCTSPDPGPPVPITFETGVCEGSCPAWEATVTEEGGVFRGGQFSRVVGERRFALTREQYRAIATTLASVRPKGERALYAGQPGCEHAPTDMRTIQVRWGTSDRLIFYTGCAGHGNARMNDLLLEAERLLPVSHLVGN